MNGNLPPGVTGSEDYFYPPDEAEPCECGHSLGEHCGADDGVCQADGCDCTEYLIDPDPTDEELNR